MEVAVSAIVIWEQWSPPNCRSSSCAREDTKMNTEFPGIIDGHGWLGCKLRVRTSEGNTLLIERSHIKISYSASTINDLPVLLFGCWKHFNLPESQFLRFKAVIIVAMLLCICVQKYLVKCSSFLECSKHHGPHGSGKHRKDWLSLERKVICSRWGCTFTFYHTFHTFTVS